VATCRARLTKALYQEASPIDEKESMRTLYSGRVPVSFIFIRCSLGYCSLQLSTNLRCTDVHHRPHAFDVVKKLNVVKNNGLFIRA
jgi:hypothetical protein